MRSRLLFFLCILALSAALPSRSDGILKTSLTRRKAQVPAGGGLQVIYGTIENPTSSQVYITSAIFTSDDGISCDNYLGNEIGGAKYTSLVPGLPIAPHSIGFRGLLAMLGVGGDNTHPHTRTPLTLTLHLRGTIGNDPNEVDLGNLNIVLNPYLPIVSDIDGKVFHYSLSNNQGPLTVGGKVWNDYPIDPTPPSVPVIPAVPTLGDAMIILNDSSGKVTIIGSGLNDKIAANPMQMLFPGVTLDCTDGMYTFSIPEGATSFTGRVFFLNWQALFDNAVEGYADFTVIVDP